MSEADQQEDIALRKAEIEAETQRYGFRQDVRKVVYGTMIVGVAAAMFPFAQKVAELTFSHRIESQKQDLERVVSHRTFLEQIALEGRSEDVETRIRLAEFYSFLSEERRDWEAFRAYLYDIRDGLIDKRADYDVNCIAGRVKGDLECTRLGYEIDEIERYVRPQSERARNAAGCSGPGTVMPDDASIEDDALAGVRQCVTNNKNSGRMEPEILLLGYSASNSTEGTVAWYTSDEARAASHLVIDREGRITQLGRFTERLWHAGASNWNGRSGLNNYAIGIVLENWGELKRAENGFVSWSGAVVDPGDVVETAIDGYGNQNRTHWHIYPEAQIAALVRVVGMLQQHYGISSSNVIGKSDASPRRRVDPGPAFPWSRVRAPLN